MNQSKIHAVSVGFFTAALSTVSAFFLETETFNYLFLEPISIPTVGLFILLLLLPGTIFGFGLLSIFQDLFSTHLRKATLLIVSTLAYISAVFVGRMLMVLNTTIPVCPDVIGANCDPSTFSVPFFMPITAGAFLGATILSVGIKLITKKLRILGMIKMVVYGTFLGLLISFVHRIANLDYSFHNGLGYDLILYSLTIFLIWQIGMMLVLAHLLKEETKTKGL